LNLKTKILDHSNLKEVSKCHISSFPKSLSSMLGEKYTEKYLEWFLVSDERFLIGVEVDDKIVGYVGGCLGTGSTSQMIQYSFSELLLNLFFKPWLFFHDKIISNIPLIMRNIKLKVLYMVFQRNIADSFSKLPSMGLVIIGVHKNFQNKNLGKLLLHQFDKECIKRGCGKAHLTVKSINKIAINFYKRNGWKVSQENEDAISMFKNISN
jgi:GNAT superfamily N-acetyltransferase